MWRARDEALGYKCLPSVVTIWVPRRKRQGAGGGVIMKPYIFVRRCLFLWIKYLGQFVSSVSRRPSALV